MHLFTEYLQPLIFWLHTNPNWALLITFLISFSESLAIIGSIIPGSVTMTAIGILAGSGVMDIGLTFAAATSGAIAGDSASYALGYTFSERLTYIWPFSRYPRWLHYGKEYFARHGGKSVLIGRFFGPLRSIIPVIAGMLRMSHLQFFIANILSALGWSFLYLMPGVLIGAASSELPPEKATHLFILILALLVIIWIISQGIKWVYAYLHTFVIGQVDKVLQWSKQHPFIVFFLKRLTPKHEVDHDETAILILFFIVSLIASITITLLVIQHSWIVAIDNPCNLLLQSVRTDIFDVFFILINLIARPFSILIFTLSVSILAIYYHQWRMLRYWLGLILASILVPVYLNTIIHVPSLHGLLHATLSPTFPDIYLTQITALFSFFISYVTNIYKPSIALIVKITLTSLLILTGMSIIYLGDNWASSVVAAFCIGLTLGLLFWVLYRGQIKTHHYLSRSNFSVFFILALLFFTIYASYFIWFEKLTNAHAPNNNHYVLNHNEWWNQPKPVLPLYATNRIGRPVAIFNIQYLGNLNNFEQALASSGWIKHSESFFHSLLLRAAGQGSTDELPLIAHLYLNQKPDLIMTYKSSNDHMFYRLRLWRSNYSLINNSNPLWLGSLTAVQTSINKPQSDIMFFKPMIPAINKFKFHFLPIINKTRIIKSNNNQSQLLVVEEITAS